MYLLLFFRHVNRRLDLKVALQETLEQESIQRPSAGAPDPLKQVRETDLDLDLILEDRIRTEMILDRTVPDLEEAMATDLTMDESLTNLEMVMTRMKRTERTKRTKRTKLTKRTKRMKTAMIKRLLSNLLFAGVLLQSNKVIG
jgi:hypothetical protein